MNLFFGAAATSLRFVRTDHGEVAVAPKCPPALKLPPWRRYSVMILNCAESFFVSPIFELTNVRPP